MNYVSYIRVSTKKQGDSGLGIMAQRNSIEAYISSKNGILLSEYIEVESGKNTSRKQLLSAISEANKNNATLIVAKLDRLGRKASHLFAIRDQGISLMIVDMPEINTLTFGVFASMAQYEAELISQRTSAALKAKGYKGQSQNFTNIGRKKGAEANRKKTDPSLIKFALRCKEIGMTLVEIANEMNECGFKTSSGGFFNSAEQVRRVLSRGV